MSMIQLHVSHNTVPIIILYQVIINCNYFDLWNLILFIEIPYQSNNLLILNMIECDEEDKTEYYILSLLSLLEECISLPLLTQ